MTLVAPVSSSRVTNTTPLVVSGRCRPITMPAVRTMRPCGAARDLGRGGEPPPLQLPRSNASGCRRSVSAERPIVGDDVLAFGRCVAAQRPLRRTCCRRARAATVRRRRRPTPRRGDGRRALPARRPRRARSRSRWSSRARCARSADAREGLRAPGFDNPLRAGFRESRDEAKTQAQRRGVRLDFPSWRRRTGDSVSGRGKSSLAPFSSVQSHSLTVTSTGRTSTPCRRASATSCDGA